MAELKTFNNKSSSDTGNKRLDFKKLQQRAVNTGVIMLVGLSTAVELPKLASAKTTPQFCRKHYDSSSRYSES